MATPKGYFLASSAASVYVLASMIAAGAGGSVATTADNVVVRCDLSASARWADGIPAFGASYMGIPLFSTDGPIRLGPGAIIQNFGGAIHFQFYQGFFNL